jgi:hypothetical protein
LLGGGSIVSGREIAFGVNAAARREPGDGTKQSHCVGLRFEIGRSGVVWSRGDENPRLVGVSMHGLLAPARSSEYSVSRV